MKTVAQMAAAWAAGVRSAGTAWNNGIQQYAGNPMQAAAAQADKAVANYSAAKGKMVARLNATPVGFWKSQAAASQVNYTNGATKGLPKMTAALTTLQSNLWPAMKAASMAAGGGAAGAQAAVQVAINYGQTGSATG